MDFNDQIQHFLMKEPPSADGETREIKLKVDNPLDLTAFIESPLAVKPEGDGTFIEYAGSMTSPPCAESVTWLVRRPQMLASDEQVKAISDAIMRMTGNQ